MNDKEKSPAAPAVLPAGWKYIAVHAAAFDDLTYALSRSQENDHLPGDVGNAWEVFEFDVNAVPAASPAPAAVPESQPASTDVLRGMICWTEDEEGALCQCVKTADQVTNPEGVFVRLSTLRAALSAPAAAPVAADAGWMKNPLMLGTDTVEIRLDSGETNKGRADEFEWHQRGQGDDIIEFRLLPAPAPVSTDNQQEG